MSAAAFLTGAPSTRLVNSHRPTLAGAGVAVVEKGKRVGDSSLADDFGPVNFADIQWTLKPRAPVEAVDLLTLDEHELVFYAGDLQREIESLRRLLHETLAALERANVQRTRALARVARLVAELRISHQEVSRLRATQRPHEGA